MDRRGLRSTEQRRVIIEQLFEVTEHVTIDQLLESVRAVDPRVADIKNTDKRKSQTYKSQIEKKTQADKR